MKKIFVFIFFLMVFLSQTPAQSYILTGTVKDTKGSPISSAYILIKEVFGFRTIAEYDGTFSIRVPDSLKAPYTLLFYSANTEMESYKVTNSNKHLEIHIILKSTLKKDTLQKPTTVTENPPLEEVNDVLNNPENSNQAASNVVSARELYMMGELNDFSKWTLWEDLDASTLKGYEKKWQLCPKERYVAQLTNLQGMPLVDANVILKDKTGVVLWQAKTDNTGKAELWANLFTNNRNTDKPYTLTFKYNAKQQETEAIVFPQKINTAQIDAPCSKPKQADIFFVVDATGSMSEEIQYLQAKLENVIEKVQDLNPHIKLRIGSVFYRDSGDEYVTKKALLDSYTSKVTNFINEQKAAGGGDMPEAVDKALFETIEKGNWQNESLCRIVFLLTDAPPHTNKESMDQIQKQITLAAAKGIRIVPLVCSGADKSTEFLMRSFALATNGTYAFLTTENGIGNSSDKATSSETEKLTHLLLRIISEFCQLPNCQNSTEMLGKTYASFEKYLYKPYKENPEKNTSRLTASKVIELSPNPCNDILNVELLKPVEDLFLVDITGKALQRFAKPKWKTVTINVKDYAAGIYFMNTYYQGRWYTAKFQKQ